MARRRAIPLMALLCLPLAALAQSDARVGSAGASIVFAATPEGLPAEPEVASPILALAASPDGRYLATAHEDLSIRLRDASQGKVTRSLSGHSDVVAAVAFAPDSKTLATASYDHTIKLWPVAGGEPQTLTGHTNWVFAVAFSDDGQRLASGGYDKTIRIWDPQKGQTLQTLPGHTATVRSIAFSPDGKRLVSGSADRTARIWDLKSGGEPLELKGHEAAVRAVAFSPDGSLVATGSEDSSVRIWEASTGKPLRTLTGHGGMVWSLAFSPGGRMLASGGLDNSIRIWDPQTGQLRQELKGHTDVVSALAFAADASALITASYDKTILRWTAHGPPPSPVADLRVPLANLPVSTKGAARFGFITPDQKVLITGNTDRNLKFWDLTTGQLLKTVPQARGIPSGEISRDGTRLITAGFGSQIYLWDVAQQRQLAAIETGHPDSAAVAISADNSRLAAGGGDGVAVILDARTHAKLHELEGDGLPIGGLDFSPDGKLLATASGDYKQWRQPGSVRLWNVASGELIAALPGTKSKMRRVRFAADGATLLACGSQHEVLVYDVAQRTLKYTLPTDGEISEMALLPDQKALVLGQYNGAVSLYDLQQKKRIGELDGHRGSAQEKYVYGVSISPDASVVVSAGADGSVKLWSAFPEAEALQLLRETRDDDAETYGLAWSPDGRRIATGSHDQTIKLRDSTTLDVVRSLSGHTGRVFRLSFAPHGQWLASGSGDGTVRLWNPADGAQLVTWKAHAQAVSAVRALAVSPDSRLLAAGNRDGDVFIWDTAQRTLVRKLPRQPLVVSGIAFSPDGSLLATSTGVWEQWRKPGEVRLWDAAAGDELARFEAATGEFRGVCFNAAGTRLFALGVAAIDEGRRATTKIHVWDVTSRKLVVSRDAGAPLLTAVSLLAGDLKLVTGDLAGKLALRRISDGQVLASTSGHSKGLSSIVPAPDRSMFATTGLDGMLKLWRATSSSADLPNGGTNGANTARRTLADVVRSWPAPLKTTSEPPAALKAVLARELAPHGQQVWFAVYSPDGSRLASGGSDTVVRLWNPSTWEQTGELKGHTSFPTHAAWSPDGKRLATAGWDQKLGIWDAVEHKPIKLIDAHAMGLRKVAWSPDGQTIASAGEEGNVCLWDAESLTRQQLIRVGLAAYSVAFSPDGKLLAVGNGNYKPKVDGRISLWDAASGKHVRDVPGSMGYVFHVQYLDATHLLAANAGEGVTIWDLSKDAPEPSYRTPKDVRWVEASRDGRRIVAMHGQGWISLWDRGAARPLVTFQAHDAFGFTAAFSPDGKQIVSGAEDGKLKVWDPQPVEKTIPKDEGK